MSRFGTQKNAFQDLLTRYTLRTVAVWAGICAVPKNVFFGCRAGGIPVRYQHEVRNGRWHEQTAARTDGQEAGVGRVAEHQRIRRHQVELCLVKIDGAAGAVS